MNKRNALFSGVCLLMAATALTSCHDELDNSKNAARYTYNFVGDASAVQEKTTTGRHILAEEDNTVKSTWTIGDKIMTFVVNDGSQANAYNQITSQTNKSNGIFGGKLSTNNAITTSSSIAFFYPGSAAVGGNRTITPVTQTQEGKEYYHDESQTITKLVELNLTRQDGTLETIGKRFDFQWALKTPKKVTETDVNVYIGQMKRISVIWGLRFTDENNQPLQNIDKIYISNVKGSDIFDLEKGEFINSNPTDESMNVVLEAGQGKKFSSVGGKYTYAAFLPGTYTDVLVMAYVGNKCYKKVYTKPITFNEGQIYRTDVLKMQEVKKKPSVNVEGIEWATGNFIHYKEGRQEYWGIAPTQWWISKRAVTVDGNRRETASGHNLVSSQFVDGPVGDENDNDLFRFGDIESAHALNSGRLKQGNWDIAQKLFEAGGPLRGVTNDRSKANYGDLVWYYTMQKPNTYRMPHEDELRTLYEKANVIPAYCYTDKGTVVYGGFFTTHKGQAADRKKSFPTKVKAYYKYSDVTALVQANMGLFLPITGRRVHANPIMGLRDMSWNLGAYGQYASSTSKGSLNSFVFMFGPTEWSTGAPVKGQASAIRPVLVKKGTTDDPVFEPFKNIK